MLQVQEIAFDVEDIYLTYKGESTPVYKKYRFKKNACYALVFNSLSKNKKGLSNLVPELIFETQIFLSYIRIVDSVIGTNI